MAQIPRPVFPQPPLRIDETSVRKHLHDQRNVLTRYVAQLDHILRDIEERLVALETAP